MCLVVGFEKKKVSKSITGLPWDIPSMAIKASNLNPRAVLSLDLMANNFFTHKIGKKKGVNALYGDGSVTYSFDPDVFNHPLWEEGRPNINSKEMAAAFRAVIKGIEGNTSYMSQITY